MAGQTGSRTVDRTLKVLEIVATVHTPVSAKALARSLDCPLSTLYTLLAPLTERGYLVREAGGYTLGYRIPALNRSFQNQMGLRDGIHGLLARLRQSVGAPATYVAFQGDGLVVADVRTASVRGEGPDLVVGPDPRTHAYAHGKIALAAAGPAARRRYLEQPGLRQFTPHTIACARRLNGELRHIRRTGVALDVEEAQEGMACLAAPVLGPDGTVIGSVSLTIHPDELRTRRPHLAASVRRAAQEATLAHQDPRVVPPSS